MKAEEFEDLERRARAGTVTHEELADLMLRGAAVYRLPVQPRAQLVAELKAKHPSLREVSEWTMKMCEGYRAFVEPATPTDKET